MGLLLQDLDSMVRTTMAIKREVDDAWKSRMRVLKIRGRRANLLLLARGSSRRLLLRKGFKDRIAAIKAKARVNHLQMTDISGLTASHGRDHVTISISLDT